LSGAYSAALAGYIRWLAPRHNALVEEVVSLVLDSRDGGAIESGHRRTPEIVANLIAGWRLFTRFAGDVSAIDVEEASQLFNLARSALVVAGQSQSAGQSSEETARRFIELTRSAISSGRCHVAGPEGQPPENPGAFGWRRRNWPAALIGNQWEGRGHRVGWLDGSDLFLDPEATMAAAQQLARDQGTALAVTPRTLNKRLLEAGLLESSGGSRGAPARRTLDGQRRDVLHFSLRTLFPPETDQADHRPSRDPA
jgi:hypothetical protein